MTNKSYQIQENESTVVCEPAVNYHAQVSDFNNWNPNVPFHGTQEEWLEHFHHIEEGNFETWEEHQKKFYEWKMKYLANLT